MTEPPATSMPPPRSHDQTPLPARVRTALRAALLLLLAAATTYLALAVWVGWADLAGAIGRIGGLALLAGVAVASLNYLLRFARWQHILHAVGTPVPLVPSLQIYVAGLALTATPGKVGETLRSALLLRWRVPVGTSLAAFFVDRLTDLVGVFLLAMLAGAVAGAWGALAAAAAAAGFALRWVFAHQRAPALADWLGARPRLGRLAGPLGLLLRTGMGAYLRAWRLPALAGYVLLALLAYGLQAAVFAGFVHLLWPAADPVRLIGQFAVATLAGAASMIPGGLGAMELALIALLTNDGMPLIDATAAVVAVRAVTLWFAILAGLLCLAAAQREARRVR